MLGLSGAQDTAVPAGALGAAFLVKGKYVEFEVVSATLGVRNFTMTGAANPLDITGGSPTVVFAGKTPDHRGLALSSDLDVGLSGTDIVIQRTGPGLSMKIQANDCASGGVFQMEPARDDLAKTRITHTLGDGVFYFDNPNFRAREGEFVPFETPAVQVQVTARINFANDLSPKFVGLDSSQGAEIVPPAAGLCENRIVKRDGTLATVRHCGGVSVWDVTSGGRMGQVMGEDSTEVAPPPAACTQNCQARNRVRGGAVVLGFPFPVPDDGSRFKPRFPTTP